MCMPRGIMNIIMTKQLATQVWILRIENASRLHSCRKDDTVCTFFSCTGLGYGLWFRSLVYGKKDEVFGFVFFFSFHWGTKVFFAFKRAFALKHCVLSLFQLFPTAPVLSCTASQDAPSNSSCSLILSSLDMLLVDTSRHKEDGLARLGSACNIGMVLASEGDPFSSKSSSL